MSLTGGRSAQHEPGTGPLADAGVGLPTLFGFAAIAAVIMVGLSFVLARKSQPTVAAPSPRARVAGLSGCRALTTIGGMPRPPSQSNDRGVAKRYGVVLVGSGAGDGSDACAHAPGGKRHACTGNQLARNGPSRTRGRRIGAGATAPRSWDGAKNGRCSSFCW